MKKKVLFSILISLLYFHSFSQSRELTLLSGNSTTFQNAISQLNSSGIIHINGEITIDLNITIPSGITIKINKNGRFVISNDRALKIEGFLKAGLQKIFNRQIVLSNESVTEINSEWFGNDHTAVNLALLSAGTVPVRITKNITITNSITIDSNQSLLLNDNTIIKVTNKMQGVAVIRNKNKNDTDITISGGIVDGTTATNVAYEAILFNQVNNSTIKNLSCLNVHITASTDTGNIRLNNSKYVTIENCNVTGTWKMGIFIINGSCNSILGGKFYGTHDSAIGLVNSPGSTVDGLYVDNCGTSDGSNMSLNSENLLVINNTSINASGLRNGNGITLGHDGAPASYSVCRNNLISNNNAKGIFIQGKNTKGVVVTDNKIIGNGIDSEGTNSGGIAVYSGSKDHLISNNEIIGNRLGISLHKTSQSVLISNNKITNNTVFGIRNDGENMMIQANYLCNNINIENAKNSKRLVLKDNVVKCD